MLKFILRSKIKSHSFALALVGVAEIFATLIAMTIATLIALQLVAQTALAQENSSASAGKKGQKRTTINFEDQLIEGRTQKPELFVLLQNRMNNSRRLFKLRDNFLPEMRKTAEDVGRAESNARGSAEPAK